MSTTFSGQGHCLCGAVTLRAAALQAHVDACHCRMCRRWGGGPLLAVGCGDEVTFVGEEHIALYDSSEWAERGFCRQCGTHLFYRLKKGQHYAIPAGLLDDETPLMLHEQIFIDEKPAFYAFANDTRNLTGEEVFAKYGASS